MGEGSPDVATGRARQPRALRRGVVAAAILLVVGALVWVVADRSSDSGSGSTRSRRPPATARRNLIEADPVPLTRDVLGMQALRRSDEVARWAAALPPTMPYPTTFEVPGEVGTPAPPDLCARSTEEPLSRPLRQGEARLWFSKDPTGSSLVLRGQGPDFYSCPPLGGWYTQHNRPENGTLRLAFGRRTVARCNTTWVGTAPGPSGKYQSYWEPATSNPPAGRSFYPEDPELAWVSPGVACLGADPQLVDWVLLDPFDEMRRVGHCVSCDLSGLSLEGLDLSAVTFAWTDFRDSQVRGVNLAGATIVNSDLRNTLLEAVSLYGTEVLGSTFGTRGTAGGARFVGVDIRKSRWKGSFLDGTWWHRTIPQGSDTALFDSTSMARLGTVLGEPGPLDGQITSVHAPVTWAGGPPLAGTLLPLTAISRAAVPPVGRGDDLRGATFVVTAADQGFLRNRDLRHARLDEISFVGRAPDFSGVLLSEASLERAHLDHLELGSPLTDPPTRPANLQGARLVKADLRSSGLQGVDLAGAQLTEANLERADLGGANLNGANLRGARMRGAYASDATFTGANLSYAELRGVHALGASFDGSASLAGADLTLADLTAAHFGTAKVPGARFDFAVCVQCDFSGVQAGAVPDEGLPGASFTSTYLYGSRFTNSSLADVDFTGAMTAPGDVDYWTSALPIEEPPITVDEIKPIAYPGVKVMASVRHCANGAAPTAAAGCGRNEPLPKDVQPPPACRSAGGFRCPAMVEPFKVPAAGMQPVAMASVPGLGGLFVASSTEVHHTTWLQSADTLVAKAVAIQAMVGRDVGELVVATNKDVQLLRISPGTTKLVTPISVFGPKKPPTGTNFVNFPFTAITAVAVLPDGDVLVADAGTRRVWRVDIEAQTVKGFAGNSSFAAPTPGRSATGGGIGVPSGLAVDRDGTTYISDAENHQVWKVDDKGILTAFAGTGQAGYDADGDWELGVPATETPFRSPSALALLPISQSAADVRLPRWTLAIADTGNNVVRTVASTGLVFDPLFGTAGTPGNSGDARLASEATLGDPTALLMGIDGLDLLVIDRVAGRIRDVYLGIGA